MGSTEEEFKLFNFGDSRALLQTENDILFVEQEPFLGRKINGWLKAQREWCPFLLGGWPEAIFPRG